MNDIIQNLQAQHANLSNNTPMRVSPASYVVPPPPPVNIDDSLGQPPKDVFNQMSQEPNNESSTTNLDDIVVNKGTASSGDGVKSPVGAEQSPTPPEPTPAPPEPEEPKSEDEFEMKFDNDIKPNADHDVENLREVLDDAAKEDKLEKDEEEGEEPVETDDEEDMSPDEVMTYFNTVACGTPKEMNDALREVGKRFDPEDVKAMEKDPVFRRLSFAINSLTANVEALGKSLSRVHDVAHNLTNEVDKITSAGSADIFAMQKRDSETINIAGRKGYLMLMGLTGNIRRITLWNSGIQLQLRAPNIDQLLTYQRDLEQLATKYGRNLGMPFYLFADAAITEYVVDQFLPKLIVSSNLATGSNWEALKKQISYQDYQTIMVALIGLTYPTGIKTSLRCSNPNCNHEEEIEFDFSKLILVNRELIKPEAISILHSASKLGTDAVTAYKKTFGFDRTIDVNYESNGQQRKWVVKLRQCTLDEYVQASKAYIAEMETKDLKKTYDINNYVATSELRMFKPWIAEIRSTFNKDGKECTTVISNDSKDAYNDITINAILDEWQTYCPEVREKLTDYILDTRVAHIAFYYPKCVACGQPSNGSYGGYIPYDAQAGFFTQARLRIVQLVQKSGQKNG